MANDEKHIFVDSIFGVSVGVPESNIEQIKVDFDVFKLPDDAVVSFDQFRNAEKQNPGQEIANVNITNETQKNVVLRVFITKDEYERGFRQIFKYVNGWAALANNSRKKIHG